MRLRPKRKRGASRLSRIELALVDAGNAFPRQSPRNAIPVLRRLPGDSAGVCRSFLFSRARVGADADVQPCGARGGDAGAPDGGGNRTAFVAHRAYQGGVAHSKDREWSWA